jgi:hypothetical protein
LARIPCPACGRVFTAQDSLDSHIFANHRGDRFYVRVNERVAADLVLLQDPVCSVVVIPLGHHPVDVTWVTVGTEMGGSLRVEPGTRQGLLKVGTISRGVLNVEGKCGQHVRTYQVHVRSVPPLDEDDLDVRVLQVQMALSATATGVRLEQLAPLRLQKDDELAGRYLDGFHEYMLSVALERERRWEEASHAAERAWGRLNIFNTHLARSALAVLAFRMDMFEYLAHPQTNSTLEPVAAYLLSPSREGAVRHGRGTRGVWIEPYQERLIAAVQRARASEFPSARDLLAGRDVAFDESPFNRRKLAILQARIAAGLGERQAARGAYRELVDDPLYGAEAERYLV